VERRPRRSLRTPALTAGALLVSLVVCSVTYGGPPPERTVRVRWSGSKNPNGASSQPVMSSDGRFVAFASRASNWGVKDPNGHVSDVYLWDQYGGSFGLVSSTTAVKGADGPSSAPAISASGAVVAFVSSATNLVTGDTNHASDVFVRTPAGVVRVSVATDGAQINGPSTQPDISADGRFVTFTSQASKLEPPEVYVHDLVTGATGLVSARPDGRPGTGPAGNSAVSADGRFVAFQSAAPDLVARDTNRVADVFVRDLATQVTQRVSVSSSGRQQNRAVASPFTPVPDISGNGRVVVFDSDATNLVPRDRNHHTDVFARDLATHVTSRVSLATTDQEGDSDSFAPTLSSDGRYVTFESYATNLTPRDPPREDIFVRDRQRHQTVMADVSSSNRPRGPEHVRQLLQRAAVSDDGRTVAFVSTATDLAIRDRDRAQDVFLRRLWPPPLATASPRASIQGGHIVVTFTAQSRGAGALLCRLDSGPPTICPLGPVLLPLLKDGRHVLRALPGGVGSWYGTRPVVVRITVRRHRARLQIQDALTARR
jgi:Tol biopolymer transport system component